MSSQPLENDKKFRTVIQKWKKPDCGAIRISFFVIYQILSLLFVICNKQKTGVIRSHGFNAAFHKFKIREKEKKSRQNLPVITWLRTHRRHFRNERSNQCGRRQSIWRLILRSPARLSSFSSIKEVFIEGSTSLAACFKSNKTVNDEYTIHLIITEFAEESSRSFTPTLSQAVIVSDFFLFSWVLERAIAWILRLYCNLKK